jgi:DNA-binding transcriptional MerR regulator
MSTYRISQLAQRTGVSASTLRFYEGSGLLPAERTPSGYRVYDDTAVDRLAFISSAKMMGLALSEISDLLPVWQSGVCASVRSHLAPLIDARISETDRRLAELSAVAEDLRAAVSGPDCGWA